MGRGEPLTKDFLHMAKSLKRAPHTVIIAEAGVNHNGSITMALKLVDAAAAAGADFVKFQTFKANKLASALAPKAAYQKQTTGVKQSQLEMLRALELSPADHRALIAHCRKRKIAFLSTPFDGESLDFLVNKLGMTLLKLPSGELTNPILLLKAARTRLPVILSTGMATLPEIEIALGVLAFGYLRTKGKPTRAAFKKAYASPKGKSFLNKLVTLLHCTTEYPAPFEDVNLRAMDTMVEAFGLPVGYSDHTPGTSVSIAAVARSAVLIEKHMTLDRTLPGPDHRASIEPDEFKAMVTAIREIESALGDGRKICRPSEAKNKTVARKSLVAACCIARGEVFTAENITAKRPGNGRSVYDYWTLLGQRAKRSYSENDPL